MYEDNEALMGSAMFELPEQTKEIQQAAREFAREVVLPGAMERDQTHEYPADIVAEMVENGFMGMFIPEQYGGAGYTVLDYVVALEEICYADAGVGVIMSVNNSLTRLANLQLWHRRAKAEVSRPLGIWRAAWLLCVDRTECRFRCWFAADALRKHSRRICAQRHQNVDHQRTSGRHLCNLCKQQPVICVTAVSLPLLLRPVHLFRWVRLRKTWHCVLWHIRAHLYRYASALGEPAASERSGFQAVAMATLDGGRIELLLSHFEFAQRAFDRALNHAKQREQFWQTDCRKTGHSVDDCRHGYQD